MAYIRSKYQVKPGVYKYIGSSGYVARETTKEKARQEAITQEKARLEAIAQEKIRLEKIRQEKIRQEKLRQERLRRERERKLRLQREKRAREQRGQRTSISAYTGEKFKRLSRIEKLKLESSIKLKELEKKYGDKLPSDEKGITGFVGLDKDVKKEIKLSDIGKEAGVVTDTKTWLPSGAGTIMTEQRAQTFFEKINVNPNSNEATKLKRDVTSIQNFYNTGVYTEFQANQKMKEAIHNYTSLAIISGVPKNFVTGAAFGLIQLTPAAPFVNVLLGADMFLKRKQAIKQFKEFPLETGLSVASFVAGAKFTTFLSKGVTLDKNGNIKVNTKALLKDIKKSGASVEKIADVFVGKLPKGKKGSFASASQILAKSLKKKKKGKAKPKLTKEQALALFKKQFLKKRVETIEAIFRKAQIKDGFVSTLSRNRIINFLKNAGVKKAEIQYILAEIARRQAVLSLRGDLRMGIITKAQFSQRLTYLINLKNVLLSQLRQFKIREMKGVKIQRVKLYEITPKQRVGFNSQLRLFQKQFQVLNQKQFLKLSTSQRAAYKTRLNSLLSSMQKFKQKLGTKSASRFKTLLASRFATLQKQAQSLKLKTKQKMTQKQKQAYLQLQKKRHKKVVVIKPVVIKKKPKKTTKPIGRRKIPLKVSVKRKRKIPTRVVKVKKGYNVYARPLKKKGQKKIPKQIKVNLVPITKKKAEDLRNYVVDTSLSRTGSIRKVAGKPHKPKLKSPRGYSTRTKPKFRTYKIHKKKRVPLKQGKVIERKKRLLDTVQERRRITLLKRVSQMQKQARKRTSNIPKRKRKTIRVTPRRSKVRRKPIKRRVPIKHTKKRRRR